MEINKIYNTDCIEFMKAMGDKLVNLTLTDIPYDVVNRSDEGLRKLDKSLADVMQFDLDTFIKEVYRITSGTIIMFCGREQFFTIYKFYADKQAKHLGTVRTLIWEKTNPSPMNGQYIYLSGIEIAVWFKKKGGTFNANYKNTVFKYPSGSSKLHPTEKNHYLLKELILDNSNENDLIFDPCCGSGAHCFVAKAINRNYIGCELNTEYYNKAIKRLKYGFSGNYDFTDKVIDSDNKSKKLF